MAKIGSFWTGGNVFSENETRYNLLFSLKEEWECMLGIGTEFARVKVNLFKDRLLG